MLPLRARLPVSNRPHRHWMKSSTSTATRFKLCALKSKILSRILPRKLLILDRLLSKKSNDPKKRWERITPPKKLRIRRLRPLSPCSRQRKQIFTSTYLTWNAVLPSSNWWLVRKLNEHQCNNSKAIIPSISLFNYKNKNLNQEIPNNKVFMCSSGLLFSFIFCQIS